MGDEVFNPGDGVTVMAGAFIGESGVVFSPAEVAARWPDMSDSLGEDQEGVWVVVRIFDREVPIFIGGEFLEPRSTLA